MEKEFLSCISQLINQLIGLSVSFESDAYLYALVVRIFSNEIG